MRCKREHKKNKRSCVAPFFLMVLGAVSLILAFVPMKVILILLAVFLIVIGVCLCFSC